jgi:membrane protease YdiL (CAAX protease family)
MSDETLPAARPWGPGATVLFTVLIAVVFAVSQVVVLIPYLALTGEGTSKAELQNALSSLETDGRFLAVAQIFSSFPVLVVTFLLVRLRRGPRLQEYLGLRASRPATVLRWCLYTVAAYIAMNGLTIMAGYPRIPDWMLDTYRHTESRLLLLVSVHVFAPLIEEVVFRGFMLEGLRHSRLGDMGAILLVALAWTVIHVQYSAIYLAQIFLFGILLGLARIRTESLLVPIIMHAVFSGVATIHLVWVVHG